MEEEKKLRFDARDKWCVRWWRGSGGEKVEELKLGAMFGDSLFK